MSSISLRSVAWIFSASILLVIFSFPNYFAYVPFSGGFDFRSVMSGLALVGVGLLIAVPPLLLRKNPASWSLTERLLFVVSVTLYTLSTLSIKVFGFLVTGDLWIGYLLAYPVLFAIEWLLPGLYLVLVAKRLR